MDRLNLSVQFIYTENGVPRSSLAEHRVREQIAAHNQRLQKQYPTYVNCNKQEESKWVLGKKQ